MTKVLVVLSIIGFLFTSTSVERLNFSQTSLMLETGKSLDITEFEKKEQNDNYDTRYMWTNININHSAKTKALGTDYNENNAYDSKGSGKSWEDLFMKVRWIIVTGYFALDTYTNPLYLTDVLLVLNWKESNQTTRVWEFLKTNDQWKGTGHHTATVNLKVIADYDQEEAVTTLKLKSYVYARTAGAFHSCSTISQVKTAVFVEDKN